MANELNRSETANISIGTLHNGPTRYSFGVEEGDMTNKNLQILRLPLQIMQAHAVCINIVWIFHLNSNFTRSTSVLRFHAQCVHMEVALN
jgi:hypothetical protein